MTELRDARVAERERIFATMPPEPAEFARLTPEQLEGARAIRAEYGWLAERNARRIRHAQWLIAAGMVVLVVITLAAGILSALVQVQVRNEARDRIHDVQQQRYDNVFDLCWSQDRRHDATIAELDRRLKALAKRAPARARELRASRAFTVALINALSPHAAVRCGLVAQAAVPTR